LAANRGGVAVIFLGVSLSLAADDWRQSRELRDAERDARTEVTADLVADSIELVSFTDPSDPLDLGEPSSLVADWPATKVGYPTIRDTPLTLLAFCSGFRST
jgi:hypothetical protein